MTNNDNYLFLRKGDDPMRAIEKFAKFVDDTGGNDADLNNARDLFDQWKELTDDDGVLFTAGRYGALRGALRDWVITAVKLKRNGNFLVSTTK